MLRSGDIWEGILHKSFKGYIKGIFIKYVIDIDTGKSNWIYQNAHWRATASELSGYKESAAFCIVSLFFVIIRKSSHVFVLKSFAQRSIP